ncbi:unnamed protein product [Schistosoma margrebowiei]|uniref:Uncharacterized protein n=1 Tax=Schistosoma margrebowiei TaxID=48269 RepID=A0A3P8DA06_9TREM|nr:unnamed protein product [Schistosoma margrebowiei]
MCVFSCSFFFIYLSFISFNIPLSLDIQTDPPSFINPPPVLYSVKEKKTTNEVNNIDGLLIEVCNDDDDDDDCVMSYSLMKVQYSNKHKQTNKRNYAQTFLFCFS